MVKIIQKMQINTMLNLKTRFERKKKCIKKVKRGLFRCNVL